MDACGVAGVDTQARRDATVSVVPLNNPGARILPINADRLVHVCESPADGLDGTGRPRARGGREAGRMNGAGRLILPRNLVRAAEAEGRQGWRRHCLPR